MVYNGKKCGVGENQKELKSWYKIRYLARNSPEGLLRLLRLLGLLEDTNNPNNS